MEKPKVRNSMYDPIYVSKRDSISIEDAIIYIDNFKRNKVTSLKGFINRHGEDLGRIKFEQFKNTSKHTLESYITKYGEEDGNLKWDIYRSKKDSTSYKWALNKANGDVTIAKEIYDNRIKQLSLNKFDIEYFITKYNDIEIANFELNKLKKSKDTSSYKWALNKANGDYKLADEIYSKRCEDKCVSLGNASKESLLLFNPLVKWLLENGIDNSDIFYGYEDKNEICIYDKEKKIRYYYDFCIKSLGLIVEYNGETFHPNYEKYPMIYLEEKWKHPYNKDIEVNDVISKDKQKIINAVSNGYDIHIIWSSDDNKLENIKNIIKNKINNENKKNN